AEPARLVSRLAARLLLGDPDRLPRRGRIDGDLRRLPVWDERARHPRSATAHERAGLPRLDDALSRLPLLVLLERCRGAAPPLLQPVRESSGGGAHRIGRSAADGDLRWHGNAARAYRGRRAGRHYEERRERLYRALELRPRRDLRRHRYLH